MAGRGKECLWWSVSIPFILLSLAFFAGFIGLATASIINSQIDSDRYLMAVDNSEDDFNRYWFLYMIGSSISCLPYAIFGTVTAALLLEAIKATRERKRSGHSDKNNTPKPSVNKRESSQEMVTHSPVHHGHIEGMIDTVSGEELYKFNGAELASISIPSTITVFIALLTSSLSLSAIFWGVAIAYNNARVVDKDVGVYIVVDVIVGLLSPILAITSAVLFSIFFEYVTQGSLDARVFISKVLPVVKLVRGNVKQYWVIENRFYFELNSLDTESREDCDEDHDGPPARVPCSKYCSRTPSTWILATIVSLAFLLSISYFMNQNITEQVTLQSCPHSSSMETDCFNASNFNYIDCMNPEIQNTTFELLHCFRFLRFGRDTDVIGGVSRAFAFYLATLAFFTSAFHVANILINFLPTKLWGVGFIILGVLTIGAGLTVLLTREAVLLQLDVIQVIQVFMVAIFIVLIGVLLLVGNWWERVGESGKGKGKGKKRSMDVELERVTEVVGKKRDMKKTKKELDTQV